MKLRDFQSLQIRYLEKNEKMLSLAYNEVCQALEKRFIDQLKRTNAELILESQLTESSKQHFFKSSWIGSYNFDFFFPYLTSGELSIVEGRRIDKYRGLVIEVDGDFHYNEVKMKKDQYKYDLLKSLGIGCVVIHNESIRAKSAPYSELMRKISSSPKIDYRAKKRLMRSIHLETIYSNLSLISQNNLHWCQRLLKGLESRW
jgi:hypothetical protein